MRRKICRVLVALGCLVGLTGAAMGGPVFTCTLGNFLSTLNEANTLGAGNYGEVCVSLDDSTHATIQVHTFTGFEMFGSGALGLQVNSGTGFNIGAGGIVGAPVGTTYAIASPGSTEDGFGKFNLSIDFPDGPASGRTFLTFQLVNNASTWANASSVLQANGSGYDAGIQIATCTTTGCTGNGFAAELYSNGHVVPQPAPEPGILGLLGMALLAWSLPALRRRKA